MAPEQERVARAARTAHFAVGTGSGPHTTPVQVTWAAGRLWLLTPRRSVKARAAMRGPVAALLRADGRTLLLRGRAVVLDPLRPASLLRAASPRLLPASARYLATQAGETAAIARDALAALARDLDTRALAARSVVVLDPDSAHLLDTGRPPRGVVSHEPQRCTTHHTPGAAEATLTVETPDGPLPLPARWRGRPERIALPPAAALLVPGGLATPRACLTVVTADEPGLRGKAGLLLRGRAAFSGDRRGVALSVSRATWWRGTETGTLRPAEIQEVQRRHAR